MYMMSSHFRIQKMLKNFKKRRKFCFPKCRKPSNFSLLWQINLTMSGWKARY